MQIPFNDSAGPSLGVEVELLLVDRQTGELASAATEILAELAANHPGVDHPEGEHPKAKHELLECTIEIITGICQTVGEARADLEATLAEVQEAAAVRGLALICTGSHPFSRPADQVVSPNPRYAQLVDQMQWMARRLQIFGVHVHVGVRSAEKAIAFTQALSVYLPHLLALSASSPYWEGEDTGLASTRSKVFEGLPNAGLPMPMNGYADYELFVETMLNAGAIRDIRQVWWDIRPHPDFGTVELRMCDGIPTMAEVATVAAVAQCLVAWLDERHDQGEPLPMRRSWVHHQNKWRAARYGLDAALIVDDHGSQAPIRQEIVALVDLLEPTAVRLGCSAELAAVTDILDGGASYERQRRVAGADHDLHAVVDALIAEMAQGQSWGSQP